jgi:hypothetical protein
MASGVRLGALLALLLAAETGGAQCLSDVQADIRVPLVSGPVSFKQNLAPGDARVVGRAWPQRGRETVRVDLRFDYRIPKDVIAFDEIICEIEVLVEDAAGGEVARSVIDPNSINLNPNRVPLSYATTLYKSGGTALRIRIRGNYE